MFKIPREILETSLSVLLHQTLENDMEGVTVIGNEILTFLQEKYADESIDKRKIIAAMYMMSLYLTERGLVLALDDENFPADVKEGVKRELAMLNLLYPTGDPNEKS